MIGNFLAITIDQLNGFIESPDKVADFIYNDEEKNELCVEKDWNAIHFLLTGNNELVTDQNIVTILEKVVFGGKEIGNDVGYGSATYLTDLEVKEVYRELEKITPEEFAKRYNPEKMSDVYAYGNCTIDDLRYLLTSFNDMKRFYKNAAENNLAMLKYIN